MPRLTKGLLLPLRQVRHNSTAPTMVMEQRGRKLTPWLRAMKDIRQRGENPPPPLLSAPLTPKHMKESFYAVTLPFSRNEVCLMAPRIDVRNY